MQAPTHNTKFEIWTYDENGKFGHYDTAWNKESTQNIISNLAENGQKCTVVYVPELFGDTTEIGQWAEIERFQDLVRDCYGLD